MFETTLEDGTVLQWNIGEQCMIEGQVVTIASRIDADGHLLVYMPTGWDNRRELTQVHSSWLRKMPSPDVSVMSAINGSGDINSLTLSTYNNGSATYFFARDGGSTQVGEAFPTDVVRLTKETETLLAALLRPRNVLESLARAAIEGDRAAAAALVDAIKDWLDR